MDVSLVCRNRGYKNLYRWFQKSRSSTMQYKLLETLHRGSGKGEGERTRAARAGPWRGTQAGESFEPPGAIRHTRANCRIVCTNCLWTYSQPLPLSIPSSNACPSCPLGPRLYITDSQLEETYRGYWFIPPQRRKWNIPELPFFSSPRRCSATPPPHFHLIVKNQQAAYSLFCQLKSHMLFPVTSL